MWSEVPDLVLPRPHRGPSQLTDVGCLNCVQASLAGNWFHAISLPTSHSYMTTMWPSHLHSSTWNKILVAAANQRPQRNKQASLKTELLTLRLVKCYYSLSALNQLLSCISLWKAQMLFWFRNKRQEQITEPCFCDKKFMPPYLWPFLDCWGGFKFRYVVCPGASFSK